MSKPQVLSDLRLCIMSFRTMVKGIFYLLLCSQFPKKLKKCTGTCFKNCKCEFRLGKNTGCRVDDFGIHQIDEFVSQDCIINFKYLIVFGRGEGLAEKFCQNAILQGFLDFQIPRELCPDGPG